MFKRTKYLDQIKEELLDLSTILFLIGARQVGKTTLLESLVYFDYIDNEKTLFLNGDELINFGLKNYEDLIGYINNKIDLTNLKFLIIDESQFLENIGLSLKILIDKIRKKEFNFKVIVSSSGSLSIFKGITDTLTGRKVILKVYPFSFEEFLLVKGEKNILGKEDWRLLKYLRYFDEYILFGGYPKVVLTKDPEKKFKIFFNLLNDYIFRDVTILLKEKEIIKFRDFLKIVSSKVGSTINITNLIEELGISRNILEKYLFVVENTFLLEKVESFVGGNTKKEVKKKFEIFFNDVGMLRFLLGVNEWVGDLKGKVIENFIFNEINYYKKSWQQIYFWQTRDGAEVDFILQNKINFYLTPIEVKSGNRDIFTKSYNNFLEYYKIKINYGIITTEKKYKQRLKDDKKITFLPYVFFYQNFNNGENSNK